MSDALSGRDAGDRIYVLFEPFLTKPLESQVFMFQVTEINSLQELQSFRLSWQDLFARTRSQRFQLSLAWLEAYWPAVTDRQLKVIVVSLAGKVIGLLPLVLKQVQSRLGQLRVLTYPLDDWGNWYGPIGPNPAATLTATLRYLSQSSRDWDLLDLTYVDRDRYDLGRSQTAARNLGWPTTERVWQTIPLIELNGNWWDFIDRKQAVVRDEIMQAELAVASVGTVQLQQYRSGEQTPDERDPLLEDWKQLLLQTDQLAHAPRDTAIALAADQAGQLDLNVLRVGGQAVAACFGFVQGSGGDIEVVRSLVAGRNTYAARNSGVLPHQWESVLLGHLLSAGIQRHDRRYEIASHCGLSQTARTLWSTELLHSYRYTMSPWRNLRGSLLVNYHSVRTPRNPRRRQPVASASTKAVASETHAAKSTPVDSIPMASPAKESFSKQSTSVESTSAESVAGESSVPMLKIFP